MGRFLWKMDLSGIFKINPGESQDKNSNFASLTQGEFTNATVI